MIIMIKKGTGVGANHSTKCKGDEARRSRVEGLVRAPQAYHRAQLTSIGVHFIRREENWRRTLEAHERPTTTTLYSHVFHEVQESTRGYTEVVTHPAITPSDQA